MSHTLQAYLLPASHAERWKHYLALQLSGLAHTDIILTLHTFYCQYAAFRHRPDLQDTCQTLIRLEYVGNGLVTMVIARDLTNLS